MTIDDGIMYCEEIVGKCELTDGDIYTMKKHSQIAEWLRELKAYKMKYHKGYNSTNKTE